MTSSRWRVQRLDVTASTNEDARRAAEVGEAEGLVVVASQQSAGRGRQGRVWESPVGNLYCSVLLRPKNMPHGAGFYSFAASLAVRDAVASFISNTAVTLKWPNDVLVGGKKISGILLEIAGDALIVGAGINVTHSPKHALYPATSLLEESNGSKSGAVPLPLAGGVRGGLGNSSIHFTSPPSVPPASGRDALMTTSILLDQLLSRLGHWHDIMQTEGFAPIRREWLSYAQQGNLTVRLPQETLQGETHRA